MKPGVPIKRQYWANAFPLVVAALGVLVAYLVPDDAGGGLMRSVSELMARLIPSIHRFVAISNMPDVTANFLAVAWVSVPLMSYLNIRLRCVTFERGEVSSNLFAFVLGALLFAAMAFVPFIWFDMHDPAHATAGKVVGLMRLVTSSRFWLGVVGSLVCWLSSAGISLLYRLLANNAQFAWDYVRTRRGSSRDQ